VTGQQFSVCRWVFCHNSNARPYTFPNVWVQKGIPPALKRPGLHQTADVSFVATIRKHLHGRVAEPFTAHWLMYVPPGLALKHSTFLPMRCVYVLCMDLRNSSDRFPIQLYVLFMDLRKSSDRFPIQLYLLCMDLRKSSDRFPIQL
jgi:hypothetical protein